MHFHVAFLLAPWLPNIHHNAICMLLCFCVVHRAVSRRGYRTLTWISGNYEHQTLTLLFSTCDVVEFIKGNLGNFHIIFSRLQLGVLFQVDKDKLHRKLPIYRASITLGKLQGTFYILIVGCAIALTVLLRVFYTVRRKKLMTCMHCLPPTFSFFSGSYSNQTKNVGFE